MGAAPPLRVADACREAVDAHRRAGDAASLAAIAGAELARRSRERGPRILPPSSRTALTASAPMLASLSAIAAHRAIKLLYKRRRSLGATLRGKREPSFPSGHAAVTTATIGMVAYLFTKRGIVPLRVARAAAVIPFGVGLSRIYLDDHWVTDVVAGWLVGVGIAAAGAAMFENERRR